MSGRLNRRAWSRKPEKNEGKNVQEQNKQESRQDSNSTQSGANGRQKIGKKEYEAELFKLQVELVKLQDWVKVQVDRIDPGTTTLDPCFSDAIYENILRELPKSKQLKDVFRSGDRNANDVSGVLVLKILVERYSPGSEKRRAVTTVTGATKLKVHIELVTRNGRVVLERDVEGDVRFVGENLGATNKVANSTARILKRSTLPAPAALMLRTLGS